MNTGLARWLEIEGGKSQKGKSHGERSLGRCLNSGCVSETKRNIWRKQR